RLLRTLQRRRYDVCHVVVTQVLGDDRGLPPAGLGKSEPRHPPVQHASRVVHFTVPHQVHDGPRHLAFTSSERMCRPATSPPRGQAGATVTFLCASAAAARRLSYVPMTSTASPSMIAVARWIASSDRSSGSRRRPADSTTASPILTCATLSSATSARSR